MAQNSKKSVAFGNTSAEAERTQVSSPAASGGAGTFFEQHVAAYWLGQLLVGAIPPILHDCIVEEVAFQTGHLGWHTEDFLIIGQSGSGSRQLAGQVKRSFTVSPSDDDYSKTVRALWHDFKNGDLFAPDTDRFVLITQQGTKTLLTDFVSLLDCARASRDGSDFANRLGVRGFISQRAVDQCDHLRAIVGEFEGREIPPTEIWSLLRVLHILSLDLNTSTSQDEAKMKTLLAHTATTQAAPSPGETSWNALLREVGRWMQHAGRIRRDNLEEQLRHCHSSLGPTEHRALSTLKDHSATIFDSIRSVIGHDLHLERDSLVQQVLEEIESSRIVLINGAAGSGKSALAKEAADILSKDHFVFSFRAEEFAYPHLDAALQNAHIPVSANVLGTVLAGQDRKVLWIESVERLLEKHTRDAFTDLLRLVKQDKTWCLVLTCRDYSMDLIRTAFLESTGATHSVVNVPPLNDAELQKVSTAYPMLSHPLGNRALREVLRMPYVLDMALKIEWTPNRGLPESERDFRARFWQEIVRVDHRSGSGKPRRREKAFREIAVQRAQALAPYVAYSDNDPEILDELRHASLIVHSPNRSQLVAPAHDILEDWAILQWLDEQYETSNDSTLRFSETVGPHPAVRRAYRKWVTELVEKDNDAADALFTACVEETEITAQFRDDTLVSLLRSSASATLLERHSPKLLANDKNYLRRIIHLLRVGCTTIPDWLKLLETRTSLINVPDGPVWTSVLRLIARNLHLCSYEDSALFLGLLEDWARGISWHTAYPEGFEAAGAIAYWLLDRVDDYLGYTNRRRVLQIIAKIPKADPNRFAALLKGEYGSDDADFLAREFKKIIFERLEGTSAARDMPEVVVPLAKDYFLCSESDLPGVFGYGNDPDLEHLFGLKTGRNHSFFPPSAYRGPFLSLLKHHPERGLRFIIDLFNHSADWYAHPRVRSDLIEHPFELTLTFSDGNTRTQWANGRLWNLYRGISVGPYVLQSALMALERWLLEYGGNQPGELNHILLDILRRSDSAAVTAVVASVATAFPHACAETLLVLLRSPTCIVLDRERMALESRVPSKNSGIMTQLNARYAVYERERQVADQRAQRGYDLESAIVALQTGSFASQVQDILNRYWAELPPAERQEEKDRLWRLALHRMDWRHYRPIGKVRNPADGSQDATSSENPEEYLVFKSAEPEGDLKEMAENSRRHMESLEEKLGLLTWGIKVFEHDDEAKYDPGQWRQKLQEARNATQSERGTEEHDSAEGGPGFIAAVCVRDHWDEMSEEERVWCVDVICTEVENDAGEWDEFVRMQRSSVSADIPCAWMVPALLGKSLDENQLSRVRRALAFSITHPVHQIRISAANGAGIHLWTIDPNLARRCVNAVATEARLVQHERDADLGRPFSNRREPAAIEKEIARSVRRDFFEGEAITDDAYQEMDPFTWLGAKANARILAILVHAPTEPMAIDAFERFAKTLVDWWDADNERQGIGQGHRRERIHELESDLYRLLGNFLLRTSQEAATQILKPILDAFNRHPQEVEPLLGRLIDAEAQQPNTAQFWSVWQLFADRVRQAEWLSRIDREWSRETEIISTIFLASGWKRDIHHWQSLEGYAERVHQLFEELPVSATVLEKYLRFLYHIGEQSLPQAFIRIAKRLEVGNAQQLLSNKDTIFLLEALLQRYVYGKPLALKRREDLRNAVFFLLEALIENGSSAAFRMRDDFVTPISRE